MEAVAEETGHLEANKEVRFEDGSVSAIQDEEFDFDIGGPGDDLEEAVGGPESTHDALAYHTGNNDALHDTRTHSIQDQEAQEAVDESHEDGIPGQDQDQQDLEIPAFDTSVDVEGIDQAYDFDDARGDQNEGENSQQADDVQYGEEGEKYQEDVYLEDTAEELGSFVDAGQQNEELGQSTTVATESVEFSNLEDGHFEDDIRDEGISAEGIAVIQSGDETQPPVSSNYVDEMTENEITAMESHSDQVAPSTSPGQEPYPVGTAVDQTGTGTNIGLDDAGGQEAESSKSSEQNPRVRVSYGTAEFYLFAEAPDADPDDYFFENADVLRQPLSQFLPKLRQVITEDLQASDELVVKVDGLGLEFGEATTKDFLDHTTFGQVLELHDRLVNLENDSSESPQLYIYLETRPNCLHRLTELTNNANEGKGLSQVAFYYEGTPDFAAIEEESNDYDGDHQDMGSDNVSDNGSNDQIEEDLSATQEAEQPYNPFRLSESQQQAMDSSHAALAEGEVVNDPLSTDGDEGHAAYEDDNDESYSGEVQDDLELVATEASRDVSAPEAQQDSDMVPGEDEDLAAEAANDEPEDPHYVEEDVPGREEAAGTEADAEAENENFQEDDGPTDGEHLSSLELSECTASSEICACAFCMSTQPPSHVVVDNAHAIVESEVNPRVSDRQLVEDALTDVHQALVATEDWSSNFTSTTNARNSLAADLDYNNHTESTSADFNMQDYETAENDDYLDIGATEEEPTESAEYAASAGTPEPTSHDSSATATLDGEGQGHGDDVSATQTLADAGHLIQTTSQPEPGPPETETDEIHWNDDDDDENDYDNDEVDTANQNQTDLSPSSLSVKRGRQADEDDVGLGDDSIAKRRRT
ncbi:conserved glutamic acid-rich protein [Diaporthe eres]|nr:conserved glutamic acid-rich protein [Diaporthe eres]